MKRTYTIQFEAGPGMHFEGDVNYLLGQGDGERLYAECRVPEGAEEDYGYMAMKIALIQIIEAHGYKAEDFKWWYDGQEQYLSCDGVEDCEVWTDVEIEPASDPAFTYTTFYKKYGAFVDKYVPDRGDGDTLASQTVTAVYRLIYGLDNNGDVYDNTRFLKGWMNNISWAANWLWSHTDTKGILERVWDAKNTDEYRAILSALASKLLNEETLSRLETLPKDGTIYEGTGPFRFVDKCSRRG